MSKNCSCKDSPIEEGIFGEYYPPVNGSRESILSEAPIQPKTIKSYKITNENHMEVTLITWGATIISIKSPDKYGKPADIVLGFDNLENYMDANLNPYIGSIIGRCANRIKDGRFTIENKDYQLSLNENHQHHYHGGYEGLGRQVWDSFIDDCTLVMTYLSPDGEEGYPGNVLTTLKFKLTLQNKLEINISATTSKPTILNFSYGVLFNLAGHDAGEEELRKHEVSLNCDRWIFTDLNDPIPTGGIRGVGGTVMDLRIQKNLGEAMDRVPPAGLGFDHNFCVLKNFQTGGSLGFVGRVTHPESGRVLEVYSDQASVNFNTCGYFPVEKDEETVTDVSIYEETLDAKKFDDLESYASYGDAGNEEGEEGNYNFKKMNERFVHSDTETVLSTRERLEFIPGKDDSRYTKFCGFGLHPQNFPNAVNTKHFPCSILRPGQVYSQNLTYKFGVQLGNYM